MARWITVTLEDGTEEEVNLDHIVRIKRQKSDGRKTLLFEVGGNSTWCTETVEQIRVKRDEQT